jgi:hypothetical protein
VPQDQGQSSYGDSAILSTSSIASTAYQLIGERTAEQMVRAPGALHASEFAVDRGRAAAWLHNVLCWVMERTAYTCTLISFYAYKPNRPLWPAEPSSLGILSVALEYPEFALDAGQLVFSLSLLKAPVAGIEQVKLFAERAMDKVESSTFTTVKEFIFGQEVGKVPEVRSV